MDQSTTSSRVWLITGCSSGLGRALAAAALMRGDRVIPTARQPESLDGLMASYPETCRALPLDVTDSAQVNSTVAEGAAAFGKLDVVVNNAGYGVVGAFEELSAEQIAITSAPTSSARWRSFVRHCPSSVRKGAATS